MAEINPPYRLDPLQTITDVHWGPGVDFLMVTSGQTRTPGWQPTFWFRDSLTPAEQKRADINYAKWLAGGALDILPYIPKMGCVPDLNDAAFDWESFGTSSYYLSDEESGAFQNSVVFQRDPASPEVFDPFFSPAKPLTIPPGVPMAALSKVAGNTLGPGITAPDPSSPTSDLVVVSDTTFGYQWTPFKNVDIPTEIIQNEIDSKGKLKGVPDPKRWWLFPSGGHDTRLDVLFVNLLQMGQDFVAPDAKGRPTAKVGKTGLYPPLKKFKFAVWYPNVWEQSGGSGEYLCDLKNEGEWSDEAKAFGTIDPITKKFTPLNIPSRSPNQGRCTRVEGFKRIIDKNTNQVTPYKFVQSSTKCSIEGCKKVFQYTFFPDKDIFSNPSKYGAGNGLFGYWHIYFGFPQISYPWNYPNAKVQLGTSFGSGLIADL